MTTYATPGRRLGWPTHRVADAGRPTALAGAADDELVREARLLREDAWAEIYQRHAEQIFAYIYHRIGDEHAAEDLTADVFVRAIAGIRGYSYRGTPLLAWLYRIAHNVTADHRKAAARRARHQMPADVEAGAENEQMLRHVNGAGDVAGAIRKLTDEQQQVIILRFYHGMTHAETATIMGKREDAVKALQSRAVRSLRRELGEPPRNGSGT
jgi:RNA polymerase sigma-70 factor, ECF subfamily